MSWPAWLTWRRTTGLGIVSAALVVGGYDILAEVFGGNDATISKVHWDTATNHPLFVVCVCTLGGILIGHYFLAQHVPAQQEKVNMANGDNPQPIPQPTPGVPWYLDGRFIMVVLTMLLGFIGNQIQGCNASKNAQQAAGHAEAASVQSADNAKRIEAVKDAATTAAVAADEAKVVAKEQGKKIDDVKKAVEKK